MSGWRDIISLALGAAALTWYKRITKEFPDLDCVFLNAGTQSPMNLTKPETYDPAVFDNEISTNFNSLVDLTMKFLPFFQAKQQGESSFI